jgi:adenylate kinase
MPEATGKLRPNILVTGTPGVGKTSLCQLLEAQLEGEHDMEGYQYVMLAELVNEKKLYKEWDNEFNVPVFDEDMVCDELEPLMSEKGGIILEFHSSNFFPERWFDIVVLLRSENQQLYDRLEKRGYKQAKITENIECEIMEVTHDEVYDSYKPEIIMELVSNTPDDMEANLEQVIAKIKEAAG